MNYNTDESKKSMTPEETAKPSYWAVLPAGIRYDPEITAGAKLLYAEITSLADARGKGLLRTEGKEYVMQDGDVVEFLFNV